MIEVWPVIHVLDEMTTLANFAIARACGCPGVFLIQHDGDDGRIDHIASHLLGLPTGVKVGVNYLSEKPQDAVQRSVERGYAATWLDAGVHSREPIGPVARHVSQAMTAGHEVFAGVAFKGQRPDPDPDEAALMAVALGFVPTTSGVRTGIAPEVKKLALMRRRLRATDPFAIASGVTAENIASFEPFVTHVLVSTGISKSFYEFDEARLRALMGAIKPKELQS